MDICIQEADPCKLLEVTFNATLCTDIKFTWVPVHVAVIGNKRVDRLFKKAIKENTDVNIKLSKAEEKNIK